jgi:hypothetical protein
MKAATTKALEAVEAVSEDEEGDSVRGLGASESEDEGSPSGNDPVTELTGRLANVGLSASRPPGSRSPAKSRGGSRKQAQRGMATVSASASAAREELERDMEKLNINRATKAQFIELSD